MTSYQRLKMKYNEAKKFSDMFKKALIIEQTVEPVREETMNDGSILGTLECSYHVYANAVDEEIKKELSRWVALNLDKETVMHLLNMKEESK